MRKKKGLEAFVEFYSEHYGSRWESLMRSFEQKSLKKQWVPQKEPLEFFDYAEDFEDKKGVYVLDGASVYAAMLLPIKESQSICDLCAAPGGKSLILHKRLNRGSLVLNEKSSQRMSRLKRVWEEFSAKNEVDVSFIQGDGGSLCLKKPQCFDSVLVDVPCSSEKHLWNKKELLKEWSIGRTRRLSKEQYRLLCSAALMTKPGGYIVYSTCSISPYENDDVIEKALANSNYKLEVLSQTQGEQTKYGRMFLPDQGGDGPLYVCLLRVLAS